MRSTLRLLALILAAMVLPGVALAQEVTRCPEQLPAAVAQKRDAILAAAKAGDLVALSKLTSTKEFFYSFGEGDNALRYWREQKKSGDDVAKLMVAIFAMPCTISKGDEGTFYNWPSANDIEWAKLNPAERAALEKLYGRKIDQYWMEGRAKGYYVGWRGSINAKGEWHSFIAGD